MGDIAIERDNEEKRFTANLHDKEFKESYNFERTATDEEVSKAIKIGMENVIRNKT